MNDGLKNVRDTLASPENAGGGDVPPKPETFVPKAKNVSSGSPENSGMRSPVVPLGHDNGSYFMIAPSGQLRKMSAECLETGRGIRALFAGMGDDVEAWCRSNFKHLHESWCPKSAGRWIIEKCNAKGVFNPESADVRSIGVWRVGGGFAVAHCGDCVVHPDGQSRPLGDAHSRCVMIGGMPIEPPEFERLPLDAVKKLFHDIESRWGWARKSDPLIWLGWVAAASLGGFPNWRVHIYVHGIRGSGKSSDLPPETSRVLM